MIFYKLFLPIFVTMSFCILWGLLCGPNPFDPQDLTQKKARKRNSNKIKFLYVCWDRFAWEVTGVSGSNVVFRRVLACFCCGAGGGGNSNIEAVLKWAKKKVLSQVILIFSLNKCVFQTVILEESVTIGRIQ